MPLLPENRALCCLDHTSLSSSSFLHDSKSRRIFRPEARISQSIVSLSSRQEGLGIQIFCCSKGGEEGLHTAKCLHWKHLTACLLPHLERCPSGVLPGRYFRISHKGRSVYCPPWRQSFLDSFIDVRNQASQPHGPQLYWEFFCRVDTLLCFCLSVMKIR